MLIDARRAPRGGRRGGRGGRLVPAGHVVVEGGGDGGRRSGETGTGWECAERGPARAAWRGAAALGMAGY